MFRSWTSIAENYYQCFIGIFFPWPQGTGYMNGTSDKTVDVCNYMYYSNPFATDFQNAFIHPL